MHEKITRAGCLCSAKAFAAGLILLALSFGCSDEQNGIFIIELLPPDSSTVSLLDTIRATLDYEYQSKYQDNGVILALEMLCSENSVGSVLNLDTLHSRSAVIDVKFRLSDFDTLCDYDLSPKYHAMRFKLVLNREAEYARVTTSAQFHFYHL